MSLRFRIWCQLCVLPALCSSSRPLLQQQQQQQQPMLRQSLRTARLWSRLTTRAGSSSASAAPFADYVQRLSAVRARMDAHGVDAFIVPSSDLHMSEYTAPHFARREFVSGFTGSAGTAVITKTQALLWTDPRYYLQAESELNNQWTVMRVESSPSIIEYLTSRKHWPSEALDNPLVIGIDPFVHDASFVEKLQHALQEHHPADRSKPGVVVKFLPSNPVDEIWDGRPPKPHGLVRTHPLQFAGRTASEKLAELREKLSSETWGADAIVLGALDEIMYLLNVRGRDIPCNPVAMCYLAVTRRSAVLFLDSSKLTSDARRQLAADNVDVMPYDSVADYLGQLVEQGQRIAMDPATTNYGLWMRVPSALRVKLTSPVALMKAVKNEAELAGMRAAHVRDGLALVEFMAWLFDRVQQGTAISETMIDEALSKFRKAQGNFIEPSFPTIAGVNEHGAIVHYRATKSSEKLLTDSDMILIDSGAQYVDGTTDVTRTLHMGRPTREQKEMFTRVLKGHIALDSCVFPPGTPGAALDAFARRSLWEVGLDYGHGTGHGVGAALNVHEGPQSISRRFHNAQPLLPGMIVSNEPGYYKSNEFGIRIENLLAVVPTDMPATPSSPVTSYAAAAQDKAPSQFLRFQRLTLVPIQRELIDIDMLTAEEIEWVDNYHGEIRAELLPKLSEKARAWLLKATEPLV